MSITNDIPPIDLRTEAQHALRTLIDKYVLVALTLGTIGTIASLYRITSEGWHPNVLADCFVYTLLIAVILLRRFMRPVIVMELLLSIIAISAILNFLTVGLVTMSFLILASCSTITSVVFGIRAGFWTLMGSIAAVAVIGFLVISHMVPGSLITVRYLLSPQTWITEICAFGVYGVILLVTIQAIQDRLADALRTEVRQSAALREREEKYRLLAENMQDVLFVQDMNLKLVYVSPSVYGMFGYTPEEGLRLSMSDYLTPDSLRRATESFQQYARYAAEKEVSIPLFEFEYIRKDGSTFWGELRPAFLRDEQGKLTGTQGLVRDITERKTAERERSELQSQLIQAEKLQAIGQLAGGIAHDFNNQLLGIMGFAELLKHDFPENQAFQEYVENILIPARRAAGLTEKLLAFARKGPLLRVAVDMHALIEEVIAILERSIDKSIQLIRDFSAASPYIAGDPDLLQSALLNLALNARDAILNGGMITFSTKTITLPPSGNCADASGGAMLQIVVQDTGIGIGEDTRMHIFEPFYSTKNHGKGTGMGLAMVYGTVNSHNGSIRVESEPGKGSSFILTLPSVQPPLQEEQRRSVEKIAAGAGRILLVDDEKSVRDAIRLMLTHAGYTVHACDSGENAVDYYSRALHEIDLVLLDMVLPGMGGGETFHNLKKIRCDVKALLLSGYSGGEEVQKLLADGAIGFIKKPFSMETLLHKIAEAL